MRRKIVVFLSIMYSFVLVAQYPVNLQASLNGMATPYLSDYASNNKLNITATLNDPTTLSLPIEIRFVIIGSGKRIENPMTFHPSTPITLTQFVALPVWGYQIQENLDANNLQFSGLDKNTYLQKKCLPEDVYSIQLQAYKWGTNIAVSQVAEIPGLWITESDPPQLNMPVDKSGVQAFLPQNILFSWTPMHIDAPGSFTDYKLELWEVIQNRNPNEVVLNTKPLWTKTLASQLIFNYGVMETQLDTGKTYAWRIQALDRDGKSYFKDNGYSQVWTFRYLPESQMPYIVPPTNLKAEEIETESAKLTWDLEPRYQGYRVEYRKTSGGKWHSQETEETKVYARNLEPKTKYEAKIQGKNGDFYGNYSSKIEFTTKEKIALKCGENPMIPTRPTLPPLAVAEKGMLIHVGLFDMVLTEVSGGGGSFSGKGLLSFPYIINLAKGFAGDNGKLANADKLNNNDCNGCFAVVFNNIGIDNERHLASGEVHVVTTGFKAFVEKEMENYKQPMSNSPTTTPAPIDLTCNFPIGSEKNIKPNITSGTIDIVGENGEKQSYTIDKKKPTTTIKDSKGDTYKIDNKTGKVTPMGSQAPSSGPNAPPSLAQTSSIDPSLATIVWNNPPDAKGGLDQGTTEVIANAFKNKYEAAILNTSTSPKTYAPFKIVPANGIDNIQATITINSPQLNKDSIRFITLSGAILNATKSNNTYTITLNGLDHAKMELVAVQAKDLKGGWQVIGKLIQRNYQEDNRTLTLIPLGNATISNKSEIETELKKQYGIANGNWTVNVADALPLPTGWNDKATIDIDAGALSCYSAEMKEIIRAYNSKVGITEPKKEDYYIFVSNIPSKNTAVEGEMPRGEHYGFIFSPNPKPKTVVHELGHGAYFYEHMWDEVKGAQKGATSNIMDYTTNPTDLRVFQWDDIHERPADFISPCWKSDDAGQLFKTEYVNLKDYLIGTNTLEKISANGKLNFVTPKGEVIQLPNTVLVNFSSYVQVIGTTTSSNLSKNAIGVLTGFYIDKISWIARFEGKKFKGYINEKGDFYPFNSLEGVNKVVVGVEFNDCKLSFKQGNYKKVINDDYNLFTEIKFENENYELIGVKAVNPERCVNCNVPMVSKPQEIQTLLNELNTNPNSASIDDKIAIVNEDNLKNFVCVEDRFLLIKNIADGFIVGDDDENSIIKLIKSTPDNQAKELVNKFQQDNSGVLKRLFSVIDGAELGDYIGEFSNLVQRSLGIDVCQKKQSDIDKKEKDFLESVKNQQLGCDVLDELVKRGILFLPNVIDNKLGSCNIVLETIGSGLNDKGEFSFIFYKNKTGVFNLPPTIDIKPFDWYKVYFTRKNDIKETGYVLGYGVKWLLNNYDNNQINVGVNRGIIVGSIFTMGTTSSVSAALWASVDLVLANGNLYIVKEEEELKKTKEGVDFINSWNKANLYVAAAQGIHLLYGVGKNIVSYKLAVSELKANYNQWRVKNLEELRKINPKLAEKLESFGTYGIKKLEEIIAEYELKVQVVQKTFNIDRKLTEELLQDSKFLDDFNKGVFKDITNIDDLFKKLFYTRIGKELPENWNNFSRINNIEFAEKLKQFRGNGDLTFNKDLRGGEGQLFESPLTGDKVLKRWFNNRLVDMPESIRLLKEADNLVKSNTNLSKYIEVVKIEEEGADWIVRGFNKTSTELKTAVLINTEASLSRQAAIDALSNQQGAIAQNILKKLNKNSANLHWSATEKKIIIIDMQ